MAWKLPALFRRPDTKGRRPDTRPLGRTGEARYIPQISTRDRNGVLAHRLDTVTFEELDRARFYPAIREAVQTILAPVLRAPFHFTCANEVAAELASQMLRDQIYELMENLLKGGMHFGFQVAEKVWAPRLNVTVTSGQAGTGTAERNYPFVWTIRRFAYFSPRDIILRVHPRNGRFAGIEQFVGSGTESVIPAKKLILFSHDSEFDLLYGVSRIKAAIPFIDMAESMYDALNQYANRFAVPIAKGRYRSGSTSGADGQDLNNQAILQEIMDALQNGSSVALPAEYDPKTGNPYWDVDFHQPPGEQKLVEMIEHVNRMIRMAVVVPEMAGSNAPDTGTYGLGKAVIELFLGNIEGYLNQMAKVINEQLLEDFRILNFGASCPELRIVFEPVDVGVHKALLGSLMGLLQSGMPISDGSGAEFGPDWAKIAEEAGIPLVKVDGQAQAREEVRMLMEHLNARSSKMDLENGNQLDILGRIPSELGQEDKPEKQETSTHERTD